MNIAIKNSYDVLLRVYAPIFQTITDLSLNIEIGHVGVLRRQEHEYGHEKFPQYNIEGFG